MLNSKIIFCVAISPDSKRIFCSIQYSSVNICERKRQKLLSVCPCFKICVHSLDSYENNKLFIIGVVEGSIFWCKFYDKKCIKAYSSSPLPV